jgi:hypothetical protein
MLEDIKTLLGISGSSEDAVLNIYIKRAVTFIKKYINNDDFDNEYIESNFQDAITLLVYNAYKVKGNENVQSMQQGQRSVTFKTVTSYASGSTYTITDDVRALLPTPYAKLM